MLLTIGFAVSVFLLGGVAEAYQSQPAEPISTVPTATLPPLPADVVTSDSCDAHARKIDAAAVVYRGLSFVGKDVFITIDVHRFHGNLPSQRDGRFGFTYVQLDAGPGVFSTADYQGESRILAYHDLAPGRHRILVALLGGTSSYVPFFARCFDVP